MKKNTEVLEFIEKNNRLPRKSGGFTEKKLYNYLNSTQYKKQDKIFIKEVEKLKIQFGINSKLNKPHTKSTDSEKKLVAFIKQKNRLPRKKVRNKKEKRLGVFFENTCLPYRSNTNIDIIKRNANLFLKYIENGCFAKNTIEYYRNMAD